VVTAPTAGVLVPAMTPLAWAVVAAVLAVLAVVTLVCVVRARRLDRLHRRTDAARVGLADALERRAAVALRVAGALVAEQRAAVALHPADASRPPARDAAALRAAAVPPVRDAAALRAAAEEARAACRAGLRSVDPAHEPSELAENTLTRRLAAVDRATLDPRLRGDLAEAEQLVVLARRVHNDAVRDTLGLRSRRLVRWLRLAGTAHAPASFEIADPAPAPPTRRDTVRG
jgi:hypothetical protein